MSENMNFGDMACSVFWERCYGSGNGQDTFNDGV